MKTILFLFSICTTFIFAQSSTEKKLIGDWSCCGVCELTKVKELILIKKSFKEIESDCIKKTCEYSTLTFDGNEEKKSFGIVTQYGCKGDLTNAINKNGGTWNVTNDNKTLIITIIDKQYKFIIVNMNATLLTLKKI